MVRFSPTSGATSATVPIAAIFSSDSIEIFLPLRRISSQQSLNATPTPARSLNGYSQPGCFGFSTAAASGSVPGRKMVIGDDHVDAALDRAAHRLDAGDAAVDGDDELHVALDEHAVEHFHLQAVAVDEPVRHDEARVRAEGAEDGLQHDDGGDAVDVVVAVDDDRPRRPAPRARSARTRGPSRGSSRDRADRRSPARRSAGTTPRPRPRGARAARAACRSRWGCGGCPEGREEGPEVVDHVGSR